MMDIWSNCLGRTPEASTIWKAQLTCLRKSDVSYSLRDPLFWPKKQKRDPLFNGIGLLSKAGGPVIFKLRLRSECSFHKMVCDCWPKKKKMVCDCWQKNDGIFLSKKKRWFVTRSMRRSKLTRDLSGPIQTLQTVQKVMNLKLDDFTKKKIRWWIGSLIRSMF